MVKDEGKSADDALKYPRRTELERKIMAHFESGVAERIIEEGDSVKFPLSIALLTLLTGFSEVRSMLEHKELVPVVCDSNIDMLTLEYSVYCLTACTRYITTCSEFITEEKKELLLKNLFLARHVIFNYYKAFYPPSSVSDFIKTSASYHFSSDDEDNLSKSKLLCRLEQCIGMKDFLRKSDIDFGFLAGVSLGAYVSRREHGLSSRYMETIDRGSRSFLDICFLLGYDELDEE